MPKHFCLTLFIFLLFCSCNPEKKQKEDPLLEKAAKIDSAVLKFQEHLLKNELDSVFNKYNFNASVSVYQNEQMLYTKNNGFENFENKTPLTSHTVFAIASISKQFTAALLLLLEEEGKINTEQKVADYAEGFKSSQFKEITLHQLLNHTSGISDFGEGLLARPGKEFHYSNKGYRVLGKIIEQVSGKTYDENVTALFKKSGMKNSFTATSFQNKNFAGAYTGTSSHFRTVTNMPLRLAENAISVPAGGILSTAEDLHRWNQALYNGKILKTIAFKKMTAKSAERNHQILGKMNYGCGLMMHPEKPSVFFHSGYVKGAPSLLLYYPESEISVIILSNIADVEKGKKAVFQPHKSIKEITDALPAKILQFRRQLDSENEKSQNSARVPAKKFKYI